MKPLIGLAAAFIAKHGVTVTSEVIGKPEGWVGKLAGGNSELHTAKILEGQADFRLVGPVYDSVFAGAVQLTRRVLDAGRNIRSQR